MPEVESKPPGNGEVVEAAPDDKKERQKKTNRERKPHPLEVLLGNEVINAEGEDISPRMFSAPDGVIGLYFAAQWCPPCRLFYPNLMLFYEECKNRGQPFEVVFVSLDRKETSFNDYLRKMPWWAVAFANEDKREELAVQFGIVGIPTLVFIDAVSLEVISGDGKDIVSKDPRGSMFPWTNMVDEQSPAEELNRESQGNPLGSKTSVQKAASRAAHKRTQSGSSASGQAAQVYPRPSNSKTSSKSIAASTSATREKERPLKEAKSKSKTKSSVSVDNKK